MRRAGRSIGVRPVTDTVKVVADGLVGETLDRDDLIAVTSPLVVPAAVLATMSGARPPTWRSPWPTSARRVTAVETLEAPPEGRRVTSADDVLLLEALTDPLRRGRG